MEHVPCKNCGSSNVHYGSPSTWIGYLQTSFMTLSPPRLTYFVCCDCGTVEIKVLSERDRQKVARDWPRIDVP